MKPMAQIVYEAYKTNFGKRTELHCIDKPYEALSVDEKLAWLNVSEEVAVAALHLTLGKALNKSNVQPN